MSELEQRHLEKMLKERQQEREDAWRVAQGLAIEKPKDYDEQQFRRFVRQFEKGCC